MCRLCTFFYKKEISIRKALKLIVLRLFVSYNCDYFNYLCYVIHNLFKGSPLLPLDQNRRGQ